MPGKTYTHEYLDLMRMEGDPLADNVIRRIVENGRQQDINELFLNLATNVAFPNESFQQFPEKTRSEVEEFFRMTSEMPDWADRAKLDLAADLFGRVGPEINLILFCKSLPMCYLCANGAKVLYGTGRLLVHDGSMHSFTRRLMETAQFVVNVMSPDGFSPAGDAIITIQKVRLIHATIRSYTLVTPWETETLGIPVNQEDMAITHLSFSKMILDALDQLGIELAREEKEAYFHLWKVVGHFLGIEEKLITENEQDASLLMGKILERQARPSPEGRELTRACMDFMEHLLQKKRYRDVPAQLTRFFIGKHWASVLSISTSRSFTGFLAVQGIRLLTTLMAAFRRKYKVIAYVTGLIKRRLIRALIVRFNEGKQVQFRIPETLKQKWQI